MKLKKLVLVDFSKDFFEDKYLARLNSLADKVVFVDSKNENKRVESAKDADALLVRYFTKVNGDLIHNSEI